MAEPKCGTCHDKKTICGVSTHVTAPWECDEKLHQVGCPYCYVHIHVMSRRQIEALTAFDGPAIAICIEYPGDRKHRVHAGGALIGVVHVAFHDVNADGTPRFPKEGKGLGVPMTLEQARGIIVFFTEHMNKVKHVYIACFGGVSRSRAFGCVFARLLGQDDSEIRGPGKDIDRNRDPNPHCEQLLLQAALG